MARAASQPTVDAVITCHNYARFLPRRARQRARPEPPRTSRSSWSTTARPTTPPRSSRRYAERGVRYVRRPQGGAGKARNTGLEATSAPLVAFLDADDAWLPDRVEAGVAHLERHPELALVAAHAFACDEALQPTAVVPRRHPRTRGRMLDELLVHNVVLNPSSVLIRRAALEAAGGFSEIPFGEDWDTWIEIAKRYPIGFIDRPSPWCRRHAGSISPQRVARLRSTSNRAIVERHLRCLPAGLEAPADPARRRLGGHLHAGLGSVKSGDRRVARRHALDARRARPVHARAAQGEAAGPRVRVGVAGRLSAASGRRAPRRELTGRGVSPCVTSAAGRSRLPVGRRPPTPAAGCWSSSPRSCSRACSCPSEFGLVAFALAVIHYLEYLDRPRARRRARSTAPTPRTRRSPRPPSGSVSCGGVVLFARLVGGRPAARRASAPTRRSCRCSACSPCTSCFTALGKAHEYRLRRTLEFRKLFWPQLLGGLDQGRGQHRARRWQVPGAWSLDHRPARRRAAASRSALWLVHPLRPSLTISRRHLRPMLRFGLGHRRRRPARPGRQELRLPDRRRQAGRGRRSASTTSPSGCRSW